MKEEIVYVPLFAVGKILKLEQLLKAIQLDSLRLFGKVWETRDPANICNETEMGLVDYSLQLKIRIDEALAFTHQIVLDEALGGAELAERERSNVKIH